MKIAVPFAKNVLAPLGITATDSALNAGIQKNTWFWKQNFKISNEEMNDMKIVRALENSNILCKGVTKKNKKVDF